MKSALFVIILTILWGIGVIAQNYNNTTTPFPYTIIFNPVKYDDVKFLTIKSTHFHPASSKQKKCIFETRNFYLNSLQFTFDYPPNNESNSTLYFYEAKGRIYLSPGDGKNNKRSIINIAFISENDSLCHYFNNDKILMRKDSLKIEYFFKEVVFNYLKIHNHLNDSTNFKLIIIPLVKGSREYINNNIRNLLIKHSKIYSRNLFVIWNQSEVPDIPKEIFTKNCKIISLFNNEKIKGNYDQIRTKPNSVQNNHKIAQTNQNKSVKSDISNDYLTIVFRGNCPDNLNIDYYIIDSQGVNITGKKTAITKNKEIKISKKELTDIDDLFNISLTPPGGYYITMDGTGESINLDDYTLNLTFKKQDNIKYLYISNIPKYFIVYIDANSFSEKIGLAKMLRKNYNEIKKNHYKFLIYLANGSRPYFSSTLEGYLNILSRIISQQTEAGLMRDDWKKIKNNLDIKELVELNDLKSDKVYIDLYLSRNIYSIMRNDISEIIKSSLTNDSKYDWNVRIISDYTISKRKRIKKTDGINYEYINFLKKQ